ncbi:DegV family protein [uncultured Clostridium sp.]|jgi:DegV family protein with EDD domain|uniref:DegV family protein n=1 Tax=uncultured Clostridium sp. TaxID=59620 RepID=UPI0026075493|nr:DegV family protein [uncultured Clostridium sp.]
MNKIKIITDSTCDLPKEYIEKYNIEVMPVLINFGEDSYLEDIEITRDEMMERIERDDVLPTTAQITPLRFEECYSKYISEGYKIVAIHMSSKMSGTYQSALIAKNEFNEDDLVIIDALTITSGLGMLVLKAAKMAEEGSTIHEIEKEVLIYRSKLRSDLFFLSLDNLVRGGRLSRSKALIVGALGIKLILEIKDGEMDVKNKVRGSKKAIKEIIKSFEETKRKEGEPVILINYLGEEIADSLREYLENNDIEYIETTVGCAVGIHSGKNAGGFFFVEDY